MGETQKYSILGEMSLGWLKINIVYIQGKGLVKLTKSFYRLGEMPGGFGETSYNQL